MTIPFPHCNMYCCFICCFRIPVKQGSEGLAEFTSRIRELFRLPEDVDISLTFGCKVCHKKGLCSALPWTHLS